VTITLKDVAQRAGVSIQTVSNFLHGYAFMRPEVRKRVQDAIAELNYQPNFSARYLRTKRAGVLAVAIPDLSNNYFSDISYAVIDTAAEQSYEVLIEHTGGNWVHEISLIKGLRPHLIDGAILSPLALSLEDLQQAHQHGLLLVLIGERFQDSPDLPFDHVVVNNVAAARIAVEHLISLGRRRIVALGDQQTPPNIREMAQLRRQGYQEALQAAGLSFDPQLLVQTPSGHSRSSGYQALQTLLETNQHFDAVFCFNDLAAFGALYALRQAGYRVPEDVAVVGFDDLEEGAYGSPSLTTIAPNKQEIGRLATTFLIGRILGTRTAPPEQVEVSFQLKIRESTVGTTGRV
jgi:DNA-binding LacI/PurR family transcriptional regulator